MKGISLWMLGSWWCVVLLLRLSDAGSMNKRDYYEVLAVPQSATDKQVKKAFHSLAMKYHPDKNKSPDAEKIFRDIAEAYEVLSNDEKRRRYNQLGHEAFLKDNGEEWEEPEAEGGRGFFYFSFDELFQDLHVVEDLYLEEPEDSWIFHLGGEHEDDPHEDQGFPGSDMFDLLGNPFISMGQGYSEFEDRDEEQGGGHFCWKLQQSDGSTVEMCEGDRY